MTNTRLEPRRAVQTAHGQTRLGRGRTRALVTIAAACLALSACATLSEAECATGDWRGIGYADGASGQDRSRLNAHSEACYRHGIIPDAEAWAFGWDEGLSQYCRADNALRLGSQGAGYNGVCTGPREALFVPAYEDGLRAHAIYSDLSAARSDLDELQYRIDDIFDEIEDERSRARDTSLSDEERALAQRRVGELKRDRDRARSDRRRVESDVSRIESALREQEAYLFNRYPWWSPSW